MSKARKLEPIGWKSALTVLSINLVRGGNQVALKFALTALPPFWTAFGRMSLGAISVGAWAALRDIPLTPHRREWPELLNLGVVFAIQIALMHYGVDYTSPAYATVLMNANPIFANLLAHYVLVENLPPEPLLSSVRSIVGRATLGVDQDPIHREHLLKGVVITKFPDCWCETVAPANETRARSWLRRRSG